MTAGGRLGRLHFERGELVDVSTDRDGGDAAALEIACWDDAQIDVEPRRAPSGSACRPC